MIVEGKGKISPKAICIHIPKAEINWLQDIANKRDEYRQYQKRNDSWGRGFIRNPTFVGLTGEHALCHYINKTMGMKLSINTALQTHGDGGWDIECYGLKFQIKTRIRGSRNLIRRLDSLKHLRTLQDGIYVFAKWIPDQLMIQLLGWITNQHVRCYGRFEKSIAANHWNLSIDDNELETMLRLTDEIIWRKGI